MLFSTVDKCRCLRSSNLSSNDPSRIQTIIECSKIYEHWLHQELEQLLTEDSNCTIKSHRTCVACYISPKSTKKILKRKIDIRSEKLEDYKEEKERFRRSSTPFFDFQQHCIFCGEWCHVQTDCKHTGRWRKAFLYRTVSDVDLKQEGQDGPGSRT